MKVEELRAASANRKAVLMKLVSQFREYLTRSWKKIVGVAKDMTDRVSISSDRVDRAHADLMSTIRELRV